MPTKIKDHNQSVKVIKLNLSGDKWANKAIIEINLAPTHTEELCFSSYARNYTFSVSSSTDPAYSI